MKISSFIYHKKNTGMDYSIDLYTAYTFWSRFWGLMGKKSSNLGVIFSQTNQIHMFFMRFPLHVFFLDRDGNVIEIIRYLKPWRISPRIKEASYVIEFPVCLETNIEIGDRFQPK